MPQPLLARRLRRLPVVTALGLGVRLARGPRARLLGLSCLDREDAGPGLLIPRCASVHTFGMRFPLDLYFLGGRWEVVAVRRGVPARRFAICGGARAVLEMPAEKGGEIAAVTS